jgi:hypothetical protein
VKFAMQIEVKLEMRIEDRKKIETRKIEVKIKVNNGRNYVQRCLEGRRLR